MGKLLYCAEKAYWLTRLLLVFFVLGLALLYHNRGIALDNPHNVYKTINCADCHVSSPNAIWWTDQGGEQGASRGICRSCHTSGGLGPYVMTHSSAAVSSTKYGTWDNKCTVCHNPHTQRQFRTYKAASYVYTGISTGVTADTLTKSGAGWTADQWSGYILLPNVQYMNQHYRILTNTADAITIDTGSGGIDAINLTYIRPGNTFAIVYDGLIKEAVGGRAVRFFNTAGIKSFADGDGIYDGICEVCHLSTTYHRNNASGDHGHSSGFNCVSCHSHVYGFKPDAASVTDCVSCHRTGRGSRRQIVDSNADGTGAGGDFLQTSHHVYPASGTVNNTDCQICHDMAQHSNGTVRLRNADTGEVYVYNPANPSTAENHCLSCHDADGANGNMSPFTDGKTLGVNPYRAGVDIKASWNKTYGHKQKSLTCIGNGSPGTGCHAGGHGSDYKGLMSKNMALPNPSTAWYSSADEPKFDLCFSCHASYPNVTKEAVLGYRLGGKYDTAGDGPPPYNIPNILTEFRDRYDGTAKAYDDGGFFTGYSNLHYFHVQGGNWSYRGTTNSSIVCISCHNVHGSNTEQGWVFDEMQYRQYPGAGSDQYGTMDAPNYNTLDSHPTNCTFNCHTFMGKTYNWFEPSGE